MVKRVLKLFHYEFDDLHKAAIVLALSAIASSILALLRNRLLAGTFGAGRTLDIYYAAFRLPDFIYIFSLAVASATVLIPVFLEKNARSANEARDFLNNIFTTFLYLMIVLVVVMFFAIPYLVKFLAPGFSGSDISQMITLTRIILLSPLLLGLSNLLSSVIQSFRRFFIYALSPVLYNVGIIIGIIFFYPLWGLKGVAFGVILGALMHLLIQIPGVIRLGFFPRPVAKLNFAEIRGVVKHSLPRTLGVSMDNVMMIFITAIASVMEVGSIAILNLSFSLQTVLLSVAGRSYSIAAFPTLAKYFVNNEKDKFVEHIATAGRQIVFWLIPFSALFIVLRAQIVRVLFGYGKFDWSDTRLTAAALALFVSSVTAQALIVLLARGYYAAGITKKPIVINICSSIVVIVLSFTFIKIFAVSSSFQFLFEKILRVEGLPGTSALTLALAYSIGMFLNAFLLIKFFKKDVVSGAKSLQKIWADLKKTILQVLWASILMGVVSYLSLNILDNWLNINTFVGIFLQGLVAGILGIIMWYVSLRFADNKELNEITSSFKQKFWKTPVVGPEAEELLQ